ncbi:ExbD/TolR family protein [Paenalcaligenes niemegkensis]|uniref:ExbD/TolR family protein n=1 Tax=Paenalcaligenes niemegkensis TaxID=2895469 RepID=UPI001EE89C73|nr:ExbD/TolR family protein [Paenalcaligenes niemegkensis]MCQ9615312.1 ExbD/TolR family protein [Paenalcaligenes niemegkensis]
MPSIRASTSRGRRRLKNEINVVPYIDVMLVLLVIFMVTAPMITPGIIDMPTVGQASEVPAAPIEVQVDQDGQLSIRLRDGAAEFHNINKDSLIDEVRLLALNENPVVIAADGKVSYESVMELMDQLRSSGFTRLGFLVNTDE